ncbi:MAG: 2-C-methyl-D-erythritol 4-phosphate cytidylyltransferase [Phycisphaerae bacterium]|nr:2-C-methyl-D-erythritol 4-phosphate cytidylyltransferase [Phycisphaerae bacterium]
MKLSVIIPAAGSATRYGSDKLAQDLGGRPVLVRTVEFFSKRNEVAQIIVVGPPDDLDGFKERYGPALSFLGVTIVAGGRIDRWESVQNALDMVDADSTHVAIHDAARPAITDELMDRLVEAAAVHEAVIPGVDLSGTIKRVSQDRIDAAESDDLADAILGDLGKRSTSGRIVSETIDRDGLIEVQTPQIFSRELLVQAYAGSRHEGATDDSCVVENHGSPVVVVDGDPINIKITVPADLDRIRLLMGIRSQSGRPSHKRF